MKVLVIGSGGREHAIVWKLKQSPKVTEIFCAPGNAGINQIAQVVDIKADDVSSLLNFAKENKIDFTVVGPEISLAEGIVDEFTAGGMKIFGPSKAAAKLENSKIFSKEFMRRHRIPTAGFKIFGMNDKTRCIEYFNFCRYPMVIKADGLAAGKGVVICANRSEAIGTINEFFDNRIFGAAGENIVIEEFLTGDEASIFAICDGKNYVVLPSSQDHKKISENETGKNTGGMGSFAPAQKVVSNDVLEKTKKRIIEPVLKHMKAEGSEFKGVLYCGLMIDAEGSPFVIEFNTRFGDPETQVVLPLVKSDLLDLFIASAEGKLSSYDLEVYNEYYCCVVLASEGYPDKYETGKEITGLDKVTEDCMVFHAGTKRVNGKILSSGGRVLNVVGKSGKDLESAINTSYHNCELINFENKYYRKDIGQKGLSVKVGDNH
jgi:phosphoribosylamine--glycine ligase